MDLNEIYSTIFPLNGVDDNNRYINLEAKDINSVQLLEPALSVTEFVIQKKDKLISNAIPDRMSFRLPLVSINSQMIDQHSITDFFLDYNSFIPTAMVEFVDTDNRMLSTNSLKDGSILKVYVGGLGDELYYKPIRQDFMITDIKKLNSGNQNQGDFMHYRVSATLNVPMGYRKESWSNYPATSMQELFNLAVYTGLGFSTNFTFTTIDEMKWENALGTTYFDFMREIANHACYSPNTFFTAFVDQYYVLNFVECHSLLSHGGSKTDTPGMIYSNYQQDEEPSVDKSSNEGKNKSTTDQISVDSRDSNYKNPTQKVSYYFISNDSYFHGWTNYIESYNEISDGYSSMSDGYRKHVTYSDTNSGGWGSNYEFVIAPIDNLERDSTTQIINPLPDEVTQSTYIPINLMQINNSDYQNSEVTSIDKMSEVESFVNFGEVDTSNMFKQYYFANAQNDYQMKCLKKCGLRVTLQNYNPAITKFSRIWVDIYDMNSQSTQNIKPDTNYTNSTSEETNDWKKLKQKINENIIYYEDEGQSKRKYVTTNSEGEQVYKTSSNNENFPRGNYNRSLSGWYVVTEMKIIYSQYDTNMKTVLTLNRIERKPLYKDEYKTAKLAVDKYKDDNLPENIFKSIDDFSY